MSRVRTDIVRGAFEAFNRGDVDAIAAVLAPDARIVPLRAAVEDVVYAGPAAARDFWADATDAWSQLRVDIEEQRDLDGRVLTLGTLHGRARHTGAEAETRAAWVSTFNAGEQIVELHTYPSEEAALVALGLGDDVDLVRRAVEAAARRPPD